MADVFDQAQERDQMNLQQSLQAQAERAKLEKRITPNGECQNPLCGEPVGESKLYCGAACAQEHAKRMK